MRLIVSVSIEGGTVIYTADADIDQDRMDSVGSRTAAAREAVRQVAERIADGTD